MRRLFLCFIICALILWSALVVRFGMRNDSHLLPEFLENADRVRQSRVCAPLATIIINSAPWHAPLRQVIRETWGHPAVLRPLGLGVAFGVGSSSDQRTVDWEAETFSDVFQLPLEDEYVSLPQKIVGLLEKVAGACVHPRPPFIVKADDDVFVNVYALQELLLDLVAQSSEKKLWCLVWEGMQVVRSNHSKWFVSHDAYSEPLYPTYCSGAAYVISSPALEAMLLQANSSRPSLTSEDVVVTGFLAGRADVVHVQLGTRYAFESVDRERVAEGRTVFAHLGPEAEVGMEEMWDLVSAWRRKRRGDVSGEAM